MAIKKIDCNDPINDFFRQQQPSYDEFQFPNDLEIQSRIFSIMSFEGQQKALPSYNWKDINNIPECSLFDYAGIVLDFKRPPVAESFDIIELPLKEVLSTLGKNCFVLSPNRWHRVRKQIAQGLIEYPEITVSSQTNKPKLMDGRHRIIAMIKFLGLEKAPFVCYPPDTETVKQYYFGDS